MVDETDKMIESCTRNTDIVNESKNDSGHAFASVSGLFAVVESHKEDYFYNNTDAIEFNSSSARVSQQSLWVQRGQSERNTSTFHTNFSFIRLGTKFGEGAYGERYHGMYLMNPVAVKVFWISFCAK